MDADVLASLRELQGQFLEVDPDYTGTLPSTDFVFILLRNGSTKYQAETLLHEFTCRDAPDKVDYRSLLRHLSRVAAGGASADKQPDEYNEHSLDAERVHARNHSYRDDRHSSYTHSGAYDAEETAAPSARELFREEPQRSAPVRAAPSTGRRSTSHSHSPNENHSPLLHEPTTWSPSSGGGGGNSSVGPLSRSRSTPCTLKGPSSHRNYSGNPTWRQPCIPLNGSDTSYGYGNDDRGAKAGGHANTSYRMSGLRNTSPLSPPPRFQCPPYCDSAETISRSRTQDSTVNADPSLLQASHSPLPLSPHEPSHSQQRRGPASSPREARRRHSGPSLKFIAEALRAARAASAAASAFVSASPMESASPRLRSPCDKNKDSHSSGNLASTFFSTSPELARGSPTGFMDSASPLLNTPQPQMASQGRGTARAAPELELRPPPPMPPTHSTHSSFTLSLKEVFTILTAETHNRTAAAAIESSTVVPLSVVCDAFARRDVGVRREELEALADALDLHRSSDGRDVLLTLADFCVVVSRLRPAQMQRLRQATVWHSGASPPMQQRQSRRVAPERPAPPPPHASLSPSPSRKETARTARATAAVATGAPQKEGADVIHTRGGPRRMRMDPYNYSTELSSSSHTSQADSRNSSRQSERDAMDTSWVSVSPLKLGEGGSNTEEEESEEDDGEGNQWARVASHSPAPAPARPPQHRRSPSPYDTDERSPSEDRNGRRTALSPSPPRLTLSRGHMQDARARTACAPAVEAPTAAPTVPTAASAAERNAQRVADEQLLAKLEREFDAKYGRVSKSLSPSSSVAPPPASDPQKRQQEVKGISQGKENAQKVHRGPRLLQPTVASQGHVTERKSRTPPKRRRALSLSSASPSPSPPSTVYSTTRTSHPVWYPPADGEQQQQQRSPLIIAPVPQQVRESRRLRSRAAAYAEEVRTRNAEVIQQEKTLRKERRAVAAVQRALARAVDEQDKDYKERTEHVPLPPVEEPRSQSTEQQRVSERTAAVSVPRTRVSLTGPEETDLGPEPTRTASTAGPLPLPSPSPAAQSPPARPVESETKSTSIVTASVPCPTVMAVNMRSIAASAPAPPPVSPAPTTLRAPSVVTMRRLHTQPPPSLPERASSNDSTAGVAIPVRLSSSPTQTPTQKGAARAATVTGEPVKASPARKHAGAQMAELRLRAREGREHLRHLLHAELARGCGGGDALCEHLFASYDESHTGYLEEPQLREGLAEAFARRAGKPMPPWLLEQCILVARTPFARELMVAAAAAEARVGEETGSNSSTNNVNCSKEMVKERSGSVVSAEVAAATLPPETRAEAEARKRVHRLPPLLWKIMCDYRYLLEELDL